MKRLIFALAAMFAVTALYAQKDSAKVVVTSDGSIVGHYVRQTATAYVANPLDWEVEVPKKGHRVEVWTPEKGKGIIGRRDGVRGNINIRKGPSVKTAVVTQMTEADSNADYPDCFFDCLGKVNGWYKIRIKGKVGYVRQDLVEWGAYCAD